MAVLACQWLLSAWLARRRIDVHADRVVVRGALPDTEVPTQGVVSVVQHFDMHTPELVAAAARSRRQARAHHFRLAVQRAGDDGAGRVHRAAQRGVR